jgi:hypothetical protein
MYWRSAASSFGMHASALHWIQSARVLAVSQIDTARIATHSNASAQGAFATHAATSSQQRSCMQTAQGVPELRVPQVSPADPLDVEPQ